MLADTIDMHLDVILITTDTAQSKMMTKTKITEAK